MRTYLELGGTPSDEDCAQVGQDDYREKALAECRRYKAQLERQFPNPPEGCSFGIKSFPHDFGSYHEVVIYFNDGNDEQIDFAYKVENEAPGNWQDAPEVQPAV